MNINDLNELPEWDWPVDAANTINKALTNKKSTEKERLLASEMAGSLVVMNDQIAATLLSIIKDNQESAEIRENALISLAGALEYEDVAEEDDQEDHLLSAQVLKQVQDELKQIYFNDKNPEDIRRYTLETAVFSFADWQTEEVRKAYHSNNEDWQRTAVFCMANIPGFEKEIQEALNSKNPGIFYEAVCAAGNWEIQTAWPFVEKIIKNPPEDKLLLIAAINAVGALRPEDASDILSELRQSDDEEIVAAVEDVLIFSEATDDEEEEDLES
jgi:hypothetical protein